MSETMDWAAQVFVGNWKSGSPETVARWGTEELNRRAQEAAEIANERLVGLVSSGMGVQEARDTVTEMYLTPPQ